MNKKLSIFYTLCGSYGDAKSLSIEILNNNMASCINLIKDIESFYTEHKTIKNVIEFGLIIKTLEPKNKFKEFLKSIHKYEIPFIAEIKVSNINQDYIDWADQKTNNE